MLKKTIEYVDYDGNKRKEDFYFNLTKSELAQLELSVEGGITKKIIEIAQKQDVPQMLKFFKLFIEKSYGEKSDDGKYFRKSPERFADFESTEAYNQLILSLMESPDETVKFFTAIFPEDMQKQIAEDANKNPELAAMMKQNNA